MNADVTKAEDKSIVIKITVPWKTVEKVREEVEEEMSKNVSVPGFRKGKTPTNIAKQKLDRERVREEILKKNTSEILYGGCKAE